jgi:hypothetical protein
LVPDKVAVIVADLRNQLDLAARLCAVFMLVGGLYVGLLVWHRDALLASLGDPRTHVLWLIPAVSVLLARVSYEAAVNAAVAYGIEMEVVFDLHRFDLLSAMHLPLPPYRAAESITNKDLTAFLKDGREYVPGEAGRFWYRHERPDPPSPADPTPT